MGFGKTEAIVTEVSVVMLPRILRASTNSSTNTEWSGSVTPLQSAGAYWNAPFDSNNGSQQEEKDQFTRRAVLFSVPSQGSVNGFLKGKNGGESLAARANFESKLSQKLIDCLTIGESPYYLLQPDARRVLEQESTNSKAMIERKLWQPKHCKQWSIKLINLMEGIFQASQELPVKDTSASLGEKTKETKDKGKSIAYKLLSYIEAAKNLKGVLEERILNAKVEFTLKEVLKIAKKEFHDVIIDSIKRKRQLMSKTGMSHAIDARICRDEEEVDIGYKQPTNEKNGYNQRVRFEDSSDKGMKTLSHYTRKHWARATTEVLVKVGDIEEPIVALVDHGSEINLMSKDLYKKQKWPIDMEHGWAIRAANNTRGKLYGACPDVKIRIGDVATEQHFFVQDTTSYLLILGQPYITATWMETKVLDDGSAYARVRSEDGRKSVQFLTVPPNHERNRDRLR
uniref:Predicted protein n=1 Tax=Physcomitrium patens TaxID=3218 RepID=A9U2P6_PHYPA